jgi:hypothetical protein
MPTPVEVQAGAAGSTWRRLSGRCRCCVGLADASASRLRACKRWGSGCEMGAGGRCYRTDARHAETLMIGRADERQDLHVRRQEARALYNVRVARAAASRGNTARLRRLLYVRSGPSNAVFRVMPGRGCSLRFFFATLNTRSTSRLSRVDRGRVSHCGAAARVGRVVWGGGAARVHNRENKRLAIRRFRSQPNGMPNATLSTVA